MAQPYWTRSVYVPPLRPLLEVSPLRHCPGRGTHGMRGGHRLGLSEASDVKPVES